MTYKKAKKQKSKKAIRECHDRLDYAWNIKQEFYKLGFKDGMRMSEEII